MSEEENADLDLTPLNDIIDTDIRARRCLYELFSFIARASDDTAESTRRLLLNLIDRGTITTDPDENVDVTIGNATLRLPPPERPTGDGSTLL